MKNYLFLIMCILYCIQPRAFAQDKYTCCGPESAADTRREYECSVMRLSLEKTTEKYGSYNLDRSRYMNSARALLIAKNGTLPNFFIRTSATNKRINEMGYVAFPIDLGIVGYRVFLTSKGKARQLQRVKTIDDLKKFNFVQGLSWIDTKILRHNGFTIYESGYENMFSIAAAGRALFSRGANEVLTEYEQRKSLSELHIDDKLSLYYPLPRFLFTSKKNTAAIERMSEGIRIAYEDGSLQVLWKKFYGPSVEFVNLKNRKILRIENPFIDAIDKSYEKYLFDPLN